MYALGQTASSLACLAQRGHKGWHWKCQPSSKAEGFKN